MKSLAKYSSVIIVVLICLLVMGIGGLAGWLLVLHMNGQTITWQSAMRGFGINAPAAGQNGSNYDIGTGGDSGGGGFAVGATAPGSNDMNGANGNGVSAGNIYGGTGENGGSAGSNGTTASSSVSLAYGSTTMPTVVIPKTPRLWHVSKTPSAGFAFATSSPMVYYAERATGYIFTADAISGDILRRTNTLMPKTYEAFLAHNGAAIYRSMNGTTGAIQTFSGIIGSSTSVNLGSFTGVNLPNNILTLAASPENKTIFFISAADDGTFSGFTEAWVEGKSSKTKQVFNSPIASWRPYVLSDGQLFVAEKAQDGAAGYAYQITAAGTLKPIVRAAPGLTFLPLANSSALVFGTSQDGALALYAETGGTTLSLPVKTIADKCVWSPYAPATKKKPASDLILYCAVPSSVDSKNFLEKWYMGALHTNDSWWRMDLTTGKSDQITDAGGGGTYLDVIDPAIDPTGNFLGFKNNADGSLWVLRINK